MPTSTKIFMNDLDQSLQKLLKDLKSYQGTETTLLKKLTSVNVSVMDAETAAVVKDLTDAFTAKKKHVGVRLAEIESALMMISNDVTNGTDEYTYDTNDNVTKHVVKNGAGVVLFTTDYTYVDSANGVLRDSTKSYKDADLKTVSVKKDYTYDASGKISKIQTTTTVV